MQSGVAAVAGDNVSSPGAAGAFPPIREKRSSPLCNAVRCCDAATLRVLPFKYLSRLLDALGQKAIIIRPVVEDACNYDEIVSRLMLDAAVHAPEKRNRRRPKMGLLADKLVKEDTSAK